MLRVTYNVIIVYFVAVAQASFGCSIGMSKEKKKRSMIAPKHTPAHCIRNKKKRSNIVESKKCERDARDAVSPENRCIYL